MGYWNTNADGSSLQAEDTGMIWGDAPADEIDRGLDHLVAQLHHELGRYPTVEEIDAEKFGDTVNPILASSLLTAGRIFTRDVGRSPTDAELLAGLRFSNSEIALSEYKGKQHD